METDKILLRPWHESDAETLYKYASDPDVGPQAGWPPHKSVEESREVIRTVFNDVTNTWAIELKETKEAIGAMGYGPVNYQLGKENLLWVIGWLSLIGIKVYAPRRYG